MKQNDLYSYNSMKRFTLFLVLILNILSVYSQPYTSQVWLSDNGDGTYSNPVLYADYSDPMSFGLAMNIT